MQIPSHIIDAVNQYHSTYRHPDLPVPEYSRIYSLFPDESDLSKYEKKWPETWPYVDRPGVYLIFDAEMQLLYVGKAAIIGRRLSSYFQFSAGRGSRCQIVHPAWNPKPAYIATIALKESFEAAALEEYLITQLHPQANSIWNKRQQADSLESIEGQMVNQSDLL